MTHTVAHDERASSVSINGKSVQVVWTRSAARELGRRSHPLVLELELYFSCLVKKFVHFHDEPPGGATTAVSDQLRLFFRVVTSTACTMAAAEKLGRQPETELDTAAARKFAPKRVHLDFDKGHWVAAFWM